MCVKKLLVLNKEEKVILNKYCRLRLNYLKEHKKAEYTIKNISTQPSALT